MFFCPQLKIVNIRLDFEYRISIGLYSVFLYLHYIEYNGVDFIKIKLQKGKNAKKSNKKNKVLVSADQALGRYHKIKYVALTSELL